MTATPCDTCTAGCLPAISGPAEEQPYGVEVVTADGVFLKQMHIPRAHTLVGTHSHAHAHLTMLAAGKLRVWRDGVLDGDYEAPAALHIPAGVKHAFLSLVDHTIAYCVHNVSRTGSVEVAEEHRLEGL